MRWQSVAAYVTTALFNLVPWLSSAVDHSKIVLERHGSSFIVDGIGDSAMMQSIVGGRRLDRDDAQILFLECYHQVIDIAIDHYI